MGTSTIDRARMVAGEQYVGKLPVFKCKSCSSTFIEPETERDFHRMMELVSTGAEPERTNVFGVRRGGIEPKRSFWSTWFGGHGVANDVERTVRDRAR